MAEAPTVFRSNVCVSAAEFRRLESEPIAVALLATIRLRIADTLHAETLHRWADADPPTVSPINVAELAEAWHVPAEVMARAVVALLKATEDGFLGFSVDGWLA
jgi:hypothetical protein